MKAHSQDGDGRAYIFLFENDKKNEWKTIKVGGVSEKHAEILAIARNKLYLCIRVMIISHFRIINVKIKKGNKYGETFKTSMA